MSPTATSALHPATLVGIVVALAALIAVPASQVQIGETTPEAAAGACYDFTLLDRSMAKATNGSRKSLDIAGLRLDPELSRAAREKTKEMIKRDLIFHDNAVLARRVTNFTNLGENVGKSPANSVTSIQSTFMASPHHRPNIVRPGYRYLGVSAISSGGALWVTVLFEDEANPGTSLKMPRC